VDGNQVFLHALVSEEHTVEFLVHGFTSPRRTTGGDYRPINMTPYLTSPCHASG
jgi:hypothetical protein